MRPMMKEIAAAIMLRGINNGTILSDAAIIPLMKHAVKPAGLDAA